MGDKVSAILLKGAVEADQPANPAYVNLKLSGLVKRDAGGVLVVRNPIYRRLFDLDWVRASRPQRALRRARKLNYFAVGLLVLGLIGGGLFYQAVDGLIRAKEVPIAKFRDCDLCPEMVVVPAGSFRMGSPVGERGRFDDEGPQHLVTIARAFAVGIYEVTFNEWDACVTTGGCKHKPSDSGWGRGRHPVINVSWEDAQEYVAWLSKKTGKAYRLLSEAEWEYAARGGTTTRYPWGDEPGTNMANFRDSGNSWSGKQTAPVGSFAANRFGLHDMSGNVWEWVEDLYRDGYLNAPEDGRPRTSEVGSQRVVRGGSWNDGSDSARVALRYKSEPASRSDVVGFRLARTL